MEIVLRRLIYQTFAQDTWTDVNRNRRIVNQCREVIKHLVNQQSASIKRSSGKTNHKLRNRTA